MAAACSSASDAPTEAITSAASDVEQTNTPVEAESTTTMAAATLEPEPAAIAGVSSAAATGGEIVIETAADFSDDVVQGTFTVTIGADILGCSGGTFTDTPTDAFIEKELTCDTGPSEGAITVGFVPGDAPGPGDQNGPWHVERASGDFDGLQGGGGFSVTYHPDLPMGIETLSGDVSNGDAVEADSQEIAAPETDAEVPANDLLANVVVIDPAALPFTDTVDTSAATSDEDDENVDCPAPATDASVWYSITPLTDMRLSVSGDGSDFPAGISAISGDPASPDFVECRPFAFVVEAEANVTYHFQVFDGEDPSSQGGNLVFSVEEAPELDRESTEGVAPLGQEYVGAVASDIEVTNGAFMFAVVNAQGEAVAGSNGVDGDNNAPMATDVFRIGSITKVFTSLATLTLVEDGVVDLDAPASQYLSRVLVPGDVTVRDLLRHTSGIYNYTDEPDFFPATFDEPKRLWTPEDVFAVVADQPSLFEAGSEFSYSNTNYVILGVLIEEVTGQHYHEVVRERILGPLELSATYLAGFENGQDVFDPYEHEGNADYDYTSIATAAWSAGAMVSSAGDLHTFITALFDDQIISSDLVAQMIDGDEYGFGMELFEAGDGLFGHSGGIPGYSTFVRHSPESGVTAFLVSTDPVADSGYAYDKLFEGFAALASD